MHQPDNLIIRPLHPDDAQSFYEIISHPLVARTLLQLPSMELVRTEQFVQEQSPGLHRLIAEIDGRVIGRASLEIPRNPRRVHSGDVDIFVHPEYWNEGIGTKLMSAVLDLADNWFNLQRLELEVLANNPAAIRLYESFGFELEGTKKMAVWSDSSFHDIHIMARIKSQTQKVLSEPKSPPRLTLPSDIDSIHIRPIRFDDADDLHAIWTNPIVARFTNHYPSLELLYYRERYKKSEPGLYRYVAVVKRFNGTMKTVGNINIKQPQNARLVHSAWFGMVVDPHYWGVGIGTHLMNAAVDLADNWLGLRRLSLEVHPDNVVALKLYKKFGFEIEGTKRLYSFGDGRWTDAHFMARLRSG